MGKFSFLRKTFLSYVKHSFCRNLFQLVQGAIHKVRPLKFCNLDSPPPIRPHTLLTYSPFPLVRVYGYYFLKEIWQIYFVNYYQSKNHKQRYRIKKLLCKAIGKCPLKTTRRASASCLYILYILHILVCTILHILTCYTLLTDQISLPDCFYFLRYW